MAQNDPMAGPAPNGDDCALQVQLYRRNSLLVRQKGEGC